MIEALESQTLDSKTASHDVDPLVVQAQHPAAVAESPAPRLPWLVQPGVATFLESGLPFRELSLLAQAERRAQDPVYSAHRWWARRPSSVFRGILLASAMPAEIDPLNYWELFASDKTSLDKLRVHDPFVGGGTTLVEAARLDAIPSGMDVDPLAVQIVQHEMERPNPKDLQSAGSELLAFVEEKTRNLFFSKEDTSVPLHYFFLHEVRCPSCETSTLLYRNLIIARSSGKAGGVVRDFPLTVFCPDCLSVHNLADLKATDFFCCDRLQSLSSGNFKSGKFICPCCSTLSTHRELSTGKAFRRLIAVEETSSDCARRIRSVIQDDLDLLSTSAQYVQDKAEELDLPKGWLQTVRRDPRPLSFGMKRAVDLFTDRQLAVFGHIFRWLNTSKHEPSVVRALKLAASNALATNNKLCSYATDYGRLAPLFSVRSYSMPVLAVELNIFHPSAGRGTLPRSLEKVRKSTQNSVRRYIWSVELGKPLAVNMNFENHVSAKDVICGSSTEQFPSGSSPFDLCIFDPPYFDYISYSELSEFYRCWLDGSEVKGDPLLPGRADPVKTFSSRFASCLKLLLASLRPGRPLAFTYHSSSQQAWDSIGLALDEAGLLVTALWPVRSDSHMGHHTSEGNCEWDVVVVCRRTSECAKRYCDLTLAYWKAAVSPLDVSTADSSSMEMAITMATTRYGMVLKIDGGFTPLEV